MAADPPTFALMQRCSRDIQEIRIMIIHLEEDPTSVCSCDGYMM